MSNIEKIKAEIERRRKASKRQYLSSNGGMSWQRMCGEEDCLVELLAFINSLPEEKPSEDLNDEIKKFIEEYGYERGEDKLLIAIVARHFAEWQKEQDQPITGNSLEQEWLRYVDRKKKECRGELPALGEYGWLQIARHFANWQKKKDRETIELAEEHAILAGRVQMKEEMMKDAVEGEVIYDLGGFFRIKSEAIDGAKYKVGSWVKLIIVKED